MVRDIPPGEYQTHALGRIEVLDCDKEKFAPFSEFKAQIPSSDEISVDLASCDPRAEPLVSGAKWRQAFEKAGVDNTTYIKDLATVLGEVLCEGKDIAKIVALRARQMSELEKRRVSRFAAGGLVTPWAHPEIGSIHILRGLLANGRFEATGAEAPALAERI